MVSKLMALALALTLMVIPSANAEDPDDIDERFSFEQGVDNMQPGCITLDRLINPCHQIAASMNGLDSPKIDVLILVPASPAAERDMRILRQSTEMWADGINWTARELGLDWLADGVEFHISMEMITTGEAEFTTYPYYDPEIVVIASNPVGGIGIGIDPLDFAGQIFGSGIGEGPCHGVANPFDHAVWENLPGFNSHHDGRSGTYVEDCGGAGGNICFSVNAAVDPMTSVVDIFQLYDLASHETGHCLTLGHVGDGAEGSWSSVPTNDIMAYHSDPPGLSKCVSTLDVEAFAVEMSRYLDTNGDGEVNDDDRYYANDAQGSFDDRPFQIQHPDNHFYASPTREAIDCPQPDMGFVPINERADFFGTDELRPMIAINTVSNLQQVAQGRVHLGGPIGNVTDGNVSLLYLPNENFLADPMTPLDDNATIQAVNVEGGNWSLVVNLTEIPHGTELLFEVAWETDDMRIDSDRVILVVNKTVPESNLPDETEGTQATDEVAIPGLPLMAVLVGLGAAARRKL